MTVRDVIVTHLKQRGWTQERFASEMGLTVGAVSSTLSKDDGNNMKVSTLVKWLDALGAQLVIDTMVVGLDEDMILDLEPEGVDYDKYKRPREERQDSRHWKYMERNGL